METLEMELKHEFINKLIAHFGMKSYLEIGLGPLQETWKHIVAEDKVCVDVIKLTEELPTFLGTSDEFFATNEKSFDLIYIDGDHSSDQVRKDLKNSLEFLNPKGIIVMHDIAPSSRSETSPRSAGDAYKIFMEIRKHPHLQAFTYFFRNGDAVGVVWRGQNSHIFSPEISEDPFDLYEKNKKDYLRPIYYEELLDQFKASFG